MDLLIILTLVVVVAIIRRDIKYVTYTLGAAEIFCELIHYIGDGISFINLNSFIDKYIPNSLFEIVDKYTGGIIEIILDWLLVILFAMFLYYVIRYIIKKK